MDIIRNKFLAIIPSIILGSTLTISNEALAQSGNPYNNGLATGQSGWTFKIGVPYVKFSNTGTEYASGEDRDYNIDTSYHVGYNLGIGYNIPSKNTIINLDYTHLQASDSDTLNMENLWVFHNMVNTATGKIKYTYDSVDLTAGHTVSVMPTFDLYYYGGLNYTRLARDMTIEGNDGNDFYITKKLGTVFKGIGPEFGIDGTCHPAASAPGFGVVGGLKTVFPYGTLSSYKHVYENNEFYSDHIPDTKTVTPGFGAKLALEYDFSSSGIGWSAQLGYQSTTYFGIAKESSYSGSDINVNFQGAYFNFVAKY